MYYQTRNGFNILARAARAALPSSGALAANGHGWSLVLLEGYEGSSRGGAGADPPLVSRQAAPGVWSGGSCWQLTQQVANFASKGAAKHGKGGGGKAAGKGAAKAVAGGEVAGEEAVPEFDMAPFVSQMSGALDHLGRELAGIRTGRASPGLLENVVVEASSHGPHVPLRALGTVVARNPQLLVVEVYNKEDADPVAAAIQNSPLKLQARVEANEVLVAVPRLTLDLVERMVRLAGQEAEQARAEVRRVRHRALDASRRASGAGGVGQEEARRQEAEVQATTDRFIREVDSMLRAKERDLREKH